MPCPRHDKWRQIGAGLPPPPRISRITAGSFSPGPQPRPMPPLAKAICRSTARTATKAAMASPTIHPIPPGPQGRGSPASRAGTARDFTRPSSYGTLGAVKGSGLFGALGRFRLKGSHGSAVLPAARVRGPGHPDAWPDLPGSSEQGGCAIHHGGDRSRWPVCPRPSLCGLSGTLRRQMVERGLRMKGRMRLTATTGATGCRPGLGRPPVR